MTGVQTCALPICDIAWRDHIYLHRDPGRYDAGLRRRRAADADDLCRRLRPARVLESGGRAHAPRGFHGGVQLSADMVDDVHLIYHLLSAGELAQTLQGDRAVGKTGREVCDGKLFKSWQ